jgi:hypothetical protein
LRSAAAAKAGRPASIGVTRAADASRTAAATTACTAGATITLSRYGARTAATASDQDAITQRGASLPHVGRAAPTVTIVAVSRRTTICSTIKSTAAVAVLAAARSADCAFAANEHRQRFSRRYGDGSFHHTA